MKLDAIIFDFDGVIVETEQWHYLATLAALKDEGINFAYSIYQERYIGIPDLLMFPLIGERYGLNVHDLKLKELLTKKQQAYAAMDVASLSTCPGLIPLVADASKQLPLGICTGAHWADIEQLLPFLAAGELQSYFKIVVTSDDVKQTKPDPEGYLSVAEQLGVNPQNCLAIEDTPVGIRAAKAANMHVLAVCTSHRANQLTTADMITQSLSDINFDVLKHHFAAKT
jgi:HAD superfamily hydrolase (TIGR01509 family)